MMYFNTITQAKLMLLGLLSLTFFLSVGSIYIAPRYAKRQSSFDSASQVVLRSANPKTIPTRLQASRYYIRYGGKRNYWETSMPETPLYTDFVLRNRQQQQQQQQQAGPVNICPFDGLYFPSVGLVRCLPGHSENPSLWSAAVAGNGDEDSDGPINASPSLSGSYAS